MGGAPARPRIGFLSTWPIYQGTTIDRHAYALLSGIAAAARDRDCDLLLGAGVSPRAERSLWRTAWPVPGANVDFVPVGPWNADGLIIVSDDLNESQAAYARDLQAAGFPVVVTTPEGPGLRVSVDNRAGVQAAIGHLVDHGHQRIAYVAGTTLRGGDSAERLRAYQGSMEAAGLEVDPALVSFGEHRFDGGLAAMNRILATGASFSALLASNDLSCLGAIESLRRAGRSVPDDVAAIGFDDILDARSNVPSLTTVRHPTFALGYHAVLALLESIAGRTPESAKVVFPARLILRQSCGCGRRSGMPGKPLEPMGVAEGGDADPMAALARRMAEAAYTEARTSTLDELEGQSRQLLDAVVESVEAADESHLDRALASLLAMTEAHGEDAHAWQAAVSALVPGSALLRERVPDMHETWFMGLLDHARLAISENVQRRTTRALLDHIDSMSQLGLLTAQLMASKDEAHIAEILAEQLPRLDIDRYLVGLYDIDADGDADDPSAWSTVLLAGGLPRVHPGTRFRSRDVPGPWLSVGDRAQSLVVLPLVVDDATHGFVVLPAAALELAAAIVGNLAMSLRASRLYREAVEGRELAEGANRLKTRFLSMVSHELRTPLSLIVGLSEMVLREAREESALPATIGRDLEHLSASAQHLGRLIGDVLDLASSQAGELRLALQPLDPADLLASAGLTGQQMAREKDLSWTATIPPALPPVMGDRTRLRQVVLNLIANAVKYTDHGAIELEAMATDDGLEVKVSDTGPGIPLDEQDRIFDEFYRSERATSSGPGGLGLGLAIAGQIVRQHGGRIGVRSPRRDGRGSTFFFTLPFLVPRADPVLPAIRPAVLLLEGVDRGASGGWLVAHLAERGLDVDRRAVGPEDDLVELVVGLAPGAVVLDAALAAERGWDLARQLQRRPGFEDVPLLACRLGVDERAGMIELQYLLKPLRTSELVRIVAAERLGNPVGGGPLVLVVDDDPDIRMLHARVAQEAGCRTVTAADGQTALAILGAEPVDLVLLDLAMPGMDGFDVLDAMRARETTRTIPVVVVTGQILSDDDVNRLNRGVAMVLSKGVFTPEEMIARIEAALSRRRTMADATRQLVRRATAFIEANHADSITREVIANHVSMSPDYLTDCFHKELGITPMAYLNRCRIRAARELLDSTDRTVTDIGLSVGFSDVSHFTRTFHRDVGLSPRAYRNRDRTGDAAMVVELPAGTIRSHER